jgi:hypothetical protein
MVRILTKRTTTLLPVSRALESRVQFDIGLPAEIIENMII